MAITALITLADAMPELNIANTPSDGGTKLQGFINAAEAVIEDIVGHVINGTTTEWYDGGDTTIYLRQLPVLSIQSVVETIGLINYTLTAQPVGSPVDNFGYTLDDLSYGRMTRRSAGSQPFPFFRNTSNIEVNYSYGLNAVPANVRLAALELIRHMWQIGQQGLRPGFGAPPNETMAPTPSGFLVPNRVMELCQPTRRPIAMA